MNFAEVVVVMSALWLRAVWAEQRRLNEYIAHYEELTYNTGKLHNHHLRAKRSVTTDTNVQLRFHADGRPFNLVLKRDTTTFSKNLQLEKSDGSLVPHDTSYIYEGALKDEPSSYAHGSIIDGVFTGTVQTQKDTYHIERADRYFPESKFHSIIYAEKDMDLDPHRHKREADEAMCGSSHEDVRHWMEKVQNSAIETPVIMEMETAQEEIFVENHPHRHDRQHHNIYTSWHREKRSVIQDNINRRTCTLFLQSDTQLWNRMTAKDKLGYSDERAREEITSLFATHVAGIKKIYEDTTFHNPDQSVKYTGISFVVHRVKINETARDCPQGDTTKNNLFCLPNIDVSNFLNINSLRNHDDFCLAYVFTYRDFTGGTLGLAWVGAPSRASGGICERWKEYQESNRRIFKSLNTGIVTLINYGSPVPPKVSTLTFAHEVGHNFGSPHDSGHDCTPFSTTGDPDGNYIMYASATSGDRPNNSKFSPCSKWNITRVLDAVFNKKYSKANCFVEREAAFCGNNIVEEGERCDCGYAEDCNDRCCHGRTHRLQCELSTNAQCSPSQGPCCNTSCVKIEENAHQECSAASDCNLAAFCNGREATCPKPNPRENGTACNDKTQVCINGECRGSICQKIGWEQCFLEAPARDKGFDKGKLCYVACQDPSSDKSLCISTGDMDILTLPENAALRNLLMSLNETAIKLPPGAPCNNFRGYCDVFQKCRDVDADGPLSRLKKLLFNEQTFNEIRTWIIKYWWAVLLMGVGLVVFMGIFIQVCAVHTPSSNPKKPPARKLTLKPQRLRQQGPPPPYAGPSRGGPPHGKGRGPSRGTHHGSYEMRPHKV